MSHATIRYPIHENYDSNVPTENEVCKKVGFQKYNGISEN